MRMQLPKSRGPWSKAGRYLGAPSQLIRGR